MDYIRAGKGAGLIRIVIRLMLAMVATSASASPMLIASSKHFRIFAAESAPELRTFAEGLERYDAVLRKLTGTTAENPDIAPLTIYVVADQDAINDGFGVLGYYSPNASGPYAVVPRKIVGYNVQSVPTIVLFHEYAHYFMLQNFPAIYSLWFVEGFAEFYSTVEVKNDVASVGKPETLRIHTLMSPWPSTLEFLFAGTRLKSLEQQDEMYARAWLLVHYLTFSKERGGQIEGYLRARNAGQTEEQAFKSVFHTTFADMDKELKAYFGTHQLPFFSIAVPSVPAVDIRPASDAEVAIARLEPRLDHMAQRIPNKGADIAYVNYFKHQAAKFAIETREAARKTPDDARVQTIASEAELVADEIDLATASAETAVRLQPSNARAHLILAALAAKDAKPADTAAINAARKEIIAANRAAPNDPQPLITYYRSFVGFGQSPPAIAVQGLERAYQLAPQDSDVRIMLAREYIKTKRYDDAATLLRPVAFAAHADSGRSTALKLLTSLPGAHDDALPPAEGVPANGSPANSPAAPDAKSANSAPSTDRHCREVRVLGSNIVNRICT